MYCPLHRGYSTYLIIIKHMYSCQDLHTLHGVKPAFLASSPLLPVDTIFY